jgi:hypothetical protein
VSARNFSSHSNDKVFTVGLDSSAHTAPCSVKKAILLLVSNANEAVMATNTKLVSLFNQTFDLLPREVREKIEALWRTYNVPCQEEGSGVRFLPELTIQPAISAAKREPQSPWTGWLAAQVRADVECALLSRRTCAQTDGITFRFKRSFVEHAPDDILRIAIAHELGHAYRAAQVGFKFPEAAQFRALTKMETEHDEELAVSKLLGDWGFEESLLMFWINENQARLRNLGSP